MARKADTEIERKRERTREGHPHSRTEKTPVTQKQTPNHSLQTAVDHARRLTESGPSQPTTPAWIAQAHHVGDLSVLALALRG
jgi:hypothetical protein